MSVLPTAYTANFSFTYIKKSFLPHNKNKSHFAQKKKIPFFLNPKSPYL